MNEINLIEWIDSFGCPAGWEFEDEVQNKATRIHSIGFVVQESDESIVLAPHVSTAERRQMAGHISIPRQQIIRKIVISSLALDSFYQELESKPTLPNFSPP